MPTRDELRAAIMSSENTKRKRYPLSFFGQEIELIQPSLGNIQKYMDAANSGIKLTDVLIDYAVIPGTDERIFEQADEASLKQLPFNDDLAQLSNLMAQLMGADVKTAEKN